MRFRMLCGPSLVAVSLFASHGNGQEQQYQIARWSVGSIDPDPGECSEQVNSVRQTLIDLNSPVSRQFAWVVLCNEKTWFRVKNSAEYRRVSTNTGFTDFRNHVVYINGFKQSVKDLRDTVGHEIGHQMCRCNDEYVANQNKSALQGSPQVARK